MDFTNKEEVGKALITLYYLQTQEEKLGSMTVENNNLGFNKIDAPILSDIARWILDGKPFTEGQFKVVSSKLQKYRKQLENIPLAEVSINLNITKPRLSGDGLLAIDRDSLVFFPNVYPSSQVSKYRMRWDKATKSWRGDITVSAIRGIQREFPNVITDKSVSDKIEKLLAPVNLPETVNNSPLFPFQKEAVQFLLSSPRSILALAPGLGKTACAIFAADSFDGVNLVIAPLTLLYNWEREIHKWLGEHIPCEIWHGNHTPIRKIDGKSWIVTNYDTVKKFKEWGIKMNMFDTVIVDESVLVKNRKAQRTKIVKELTRNSKRVWLLTGSPTTRFYDDLFAQANIVAPTVYRSYWKFADMFTEMRHNGWGTEIYANKPNADKLIQEQLSDIFFCRTQDQVLDIPDLIIDNYHVRMSKKQYAPYKQMENEFLALLPESDEVVLAPNVLAQLTRLIQLASNPLIIGGADVGAKWDAAEELLEFEKLPAIIWTSYIVTAEFMEQRLKNKYRVARLTGQTKDHDRQRIVDAFQNGELDVLIAHPAVGKFGLTLTRGKTAIYLERSYNGDDYYQSLHRIRRIGTEHSPHVIHLIAEGPNGESTVDAAINRILKYRKDSAIKLTSGILREELVNE